MSDPLIIEMLKSNVRYNAQRQSELAHNISNIDTPGYHERDLKKVDFAKMAEAASNPTQHITMATTSPKHLLGSGSTMAFAEAKVGKAFEVSPTDNNVVLEEQMAKVNDTAMQFELSTSLLKKYTAMYKTALGNHN